MAACPVCAAPMDCPPTEAEGCCSDHCFERRHGFSPRYLSTLFVIPPAGVTVEKPDVRELPGGTFDVTHRFTCGPRVTVDDAEIPF